MSGSLSATASNASLLDGTGSVGFTTTASFLAVSSSQQQISSSLLEISRSYATTGSNTFTGVQNFSNTCNPIGFNSVASLYTAGGLQVSYDSYFSSSVFVNGNLTVFGTQSVVHVSSSQFNIGTNIITVNTATPSIRYGGLSVYDSGSTGLSGSIFWDSEANHWVYANASGSGGGATYAGGMFISGPRSSGLGCEQGTTSCMLLVGQGGDHLTSSMIYHSSTVTCVPNALNIGGVLSGSSATFGGLLTTNVLTDNTTVGIFHAGGGTANRGLKISTFACVNDNAGVTLDAQTTVGGATLALATAGNNRLTISSTGAATFSCSVTAAGSSLFNANNGTLSTDILTVRGGGGTGAFGFKVEANNGEDIFYTDNFTYNIIANPVGGKFGIGTCNPAQALEVNGNIISSVSGKIGFRYSSANGNLYSYLRSATNSAIGPIVLGGGFESSGASNEAIRFVTNDGAGNERCAVSILNSGRVGIANTGPTTQFQIRKNYWQFWDERSHGSNVGLFSIGIPVFGAAIVQIAGSRYSPGADNFIGFSTVYIRTNNVGAIQAFSCDSGTYQPSYYISGNSVNFCSLHAGSGTNYTGISVSVQASGHNNGSEAAVSVSIL
jgi:hypothetical protein